MSELTPRALERLLADARPLLDELLYGRYRLRREIGRGGMGVVYEAEDVQLGRTVALKLLAPGAARQVLREARAAARLDHPGIAAVYEAHEDAIAMRFVDGVVLSSLPRDDPRRLVRLVRDAALAVQHAHEQGIVHRDLKPSNLLVEGERVVVTDFGLAKELALDSSVSGSVLGTPAYMPPEQAAGRTRDVDARSDVYALGATLHELLSGRPPFVDDDVVRLLRRIVDEEPPPLASVPADLGLVVRKCLEKDKARRYDSASELAADLTRWLAGEPVRARPPTLRYRTGKFVGRHRVLVAAAASVTAILLVALGATWSERSQRRATEEALELSAEIDVLRRNAALHERVVGEHGLALALLDQGIATCRAFLARHDVAQGHLQLGRLLRARGRVEEARAAFDRALLLDPALAPARLERGLLEGAPREQALADLAVLDTDPGSVGRIDVELGRAQRARLAGDLDAAAAGFRRVLDYDDIFAEREAQVALAEIEGRRGNADEARKSAMSALDLMLGRGPSYVERAVRQLERDAARSEHDEAVAARPFDAEVRAGRGFQLLESGATEEGRADLQTALFLGATGALAERIRAALAQ